MSSRVSAIQKARGFTLIEMLVSMVVLVAVISLSSYSYRHFITLSGKQSVRYKEALSQMQRMDRVAEALSGTFDYYIEPIYRKSQRRFPLFIGERNSVYSTVPSAYFERDQAALYWLGVKDEQLLYCEKPLLGFIPTEDLVDESICKQNMILATNVRDFSIRYFGWRSMTELQLANNQVRAKINSQYQGWYDHYQGRERGLIPEWLELSYRYKPLGTKEYRSRKRMIRLYNADPYRQEFYLSGSEDHG